MVNGLLKGVNGLLKGVNCLIRIYRAQPGNSDVDTCFVFFIDTCTFNKTLFDTNHIQI